jgi:tripartite-type tricarboxylate transporter receptor subunit TctC
MDSVLTSGRFVLRGSVKGALMRGRMQLAIMLLAFATSAAAQTYPSRPITLVVPFAPSGTVDAVGRLVASTLQTRLNQSVIVENRAGAGGYIGAEHVTKANPDGYTLLVLGGATMYARMFIKGQATDLSTSLTPMGSIGQVPMLVLSSATLPARNIKDFVAHVRANPKKLNYGVVPNNTVHLDTVGFVRLANLDIVEIPYAGGTDAMNGLARGDVQMFVTALATAKAMIESGKAVPLAFGSAERDPQLPDVPTLREAGFDMLASTWFGLYGPLKVPADIVTKLNKELTEGLDTPTAKEFMKRIAVSPFRATPGEIQALIARETKHYGALAQASGIVAK